MTSRNARLKCPPLQIGVTAFDEWNCRADIACVGADLRVRPQNRLRSGEDGRTLRSAPTVEASTPTSGSPTSSRPNFRNEKKLRFLLACELRKQRVTRFVHPTHRNSSRHKKSIPTWVFPNLHVAIFYSPRRREKILRTYRLILPKFHFTPTWRIFIFHLRNQNSPRSYCAFEREFQKFSFLGNFSSQGREHFVPRVGAFRPKASGHRLPP